VDEAEAEGFEFGAIGFATGTNEVVEADNVVAGFDEGAS
jgi:hypothetical protein